VLFIGKNMMDISRK